MHCLFGPEPLKRQRNCRFFRFVELSDGTAPIWRTMPQMLQHRRSIHVAEIGRFLRPRLTAWAEW
jgi:hypothetical protein